MTGRAILTVPLYILQFDGSCDKNPGGTAAYGYVLYRGAEKIDSDGQVVGTGPRMSNNVGEFAGLLKGMEAFETHRQIHGDSSATLLVRGDSQLVINVMSRKWKPHSGKLYYDIYLAADELLRKLRASGKNIVQFEWIPRELNAECDALSKAHLKL